MKSALPDRVRFGSFEIRVSSGELREGGRKIPLQNQTWKLLLLLIESDGAIVSRGDIQRELWPNDTMVEFDHSINAAIKKLRKALDDSAEQPRYIETAARRGYRFMAEVVRVAPDPTVESSGESAPPSAERLTPRSNPPSASLTGKTFSHYRVLEILGGGGMGVVYRAEDLKLGRSVALKFLPEELGADLRALELFEREARAASALDHPNICSIYEFGEHEGQPFIVMQLLEGQTLRDRLFGVSPRSFGTDGAGQPFALDALLDVAVQVAAALQAAHEKGIIHRDIKPANIFLIHHGVAKILDFGVAKLLASGEHSGAVAESAQSLAQPATEVHTAALTMSHPGMAMGTAGYMSPEQVRGEHLDARTDLYSLGLVLYEMATAQRAFGGPTTANSRESTAKGLSPPVHALRVEVPAKLEAIIKKALQKDRELRYQSASAMRTDLEKLKSALDGNASFGRRRRSAWQISATALLVAIAALLSWIWLAPDARPTVLKTVQLTHFGRVGSDPIIDGSRIFFVDENQGHATLWQISVNGGEPAPFPTPLANIQLFDISPDHSELLVGSYVGQEADKPVWLVPTSGAPPHRLGEVSAHGATWSPEGSKIAYLFGKDIYVVRADGTESRKLADAVEATQNPRWSPNGETLRFNVFDWKLRAVSMWEVSASGGNIHRLLPDWGQSASCWADGESLGDWTPDGRYFVFRSQRDCLYSIWTIHENPHFWQRLRSLPVLMTTSDMALWNFSIAGEKGEKIYFSAENRTEEVARYDAHSKLFVPFLGGIPAHGLNISRNGQWVAYVAAVGHRLLLWSSKIDGSERRQLTFPPLEAFFPRWSPDGKRIAFVGIESGKPDRIYLIPAAGGTPEPLMALSDQQSEGYPNWSPDGKSMIIQRAAWGGGENAIYQVDPTILGTVMLGGSEELGQPQWSPDGRFVAAIKKRWKDTDAL